MARTEVYKDGDYISLPVTNGTLSGAPVKVGGLVGVAQTNEGDGVTNLEGYASVALTGAFRVPTSVVVAAVGDPLYISATGTITATTTDKFFGYALSTKAAGAGTVIAKIVQTKP